MIRKTQRNFRRRVETWRGNQGTGTHQDLVLRETWWLLFIPLYSRETITHTTI